MPAWQVMPAVGEEVGRVGEDEVDGIFGDGGEDFETVALIKAEVVFGVVESGGGEIGGDAGTVGRPAFDTAGRIGDGFGHQFGHRTIGIVDQMGIVDQGVKQVKAGEKILP